MAKKDITIEEIRENTSVEGTFLVKDKNNGITRSGKPYIALNLCDKSGAVKGRIWDNAEALGKRFEQGDIVKIKCYAITYQGSLQLNISAIDKSADTDRIRDFLPSSKCDPDICLEELAAVIASLHDPDLRSLLESFMNDTDFTDAFKSAPAAKSIHHDYLGGLIEHTLTVTKIARDTAHHYPALDVDLLLAGAVLHDIGKVKELSFERSFDYTDEGRLEGHIVLGIEMINEKLADLPAFPPERALILKHLVLSHHGLLEFGSPKRPKTLEALLLSYIDDIDAKMHGMGSFIRDEKKDDSKWTSYHKLFDRYIYTETFIDSDPETPPEK